MKSKVLLLIVVYLSFWGLFTSCAKQEGSVVVESLFMKELPPGQTTAAAYMDITNHTKVSQAINYVHSPISEHIEIHRSIYQDGMMQMRPVKRLTISPGESKILEPGGFHLMIFGVSENLPAGEQFEITFEFESGLVITTSGEVRPFG